MFSVKIYTQDSEYVTVLMFIVINYLLFSIFLEEETTNVIQKPDDLTIIKGCIRPDNKPKANVPPVKVTAVIDNTHQDRWKNTTCTSNI